MDKFIEFTGTPEANGSKTVVMVFFDGNTVTDYWNSLRTLTCAIFRVDPCRVLQHWEGSTSFPGRLIELCRLR